MPDPTWLRPRKQTANHRITVYLPAPLRQRLERARESGHDINLSLLAQSALERALRKLGF